MKKFSFLITILYLIPFLLIAQQKIKITGTLISDKDSAAVIFANIYIPNTTYGSYSDDAGNFVLEAEVFGSFELVFSHLEHEIKTITLSPEGTNIDLGTVQLKENAYELNEVVVTATQRENWKAFFDQFRQNFIGTTANATECVIANEKVLNFNLEDRTGELEAWAYEPLVIENRALGYRVRYDLVRFSANTNSGFFEYKGYPFFELLEPKNDREQRRWERKRQVAYRGSLMHFIRSLHQGNLEKEGFDVKAVVSFNGVAIENVAAELNKVITKDVTRSEIVTFGSRNELLMQPKKFLTVQYKLEKEADAYLIAVYNTTNVPPDLTRYQRSTVQVLDDNVRIYSNGFVENSTFMPVGGYFAWEKIAEMLPLDYVPENDK